MIDHKVDQYCDDKENCLRHPVEQMVDQFENLITVWN